MEQDALRGRDPTDPTSLEFFQLYEEEPGGGAARGSRGASAAGVGAASHRGAACRPRSHGVESRRTCAAVGAPTGGRAQALRCREPRAGDRSAQNLTRLHPSSVRLSVSRSSWWNSLWKCLCWRRSSWHAAGTQLALHGASAPHPMGPTRRDSPPAQVGTQILGSIVDKVVDVPVTVLHKLQQSVPPSQFINRVLDIPTVPQRQVRAVPNCAELRI